jgi:4-amino-4-deoxy-L-arabinose transferase-like glycosyltransferase
VTTDSRLDHGLIAVLGVAFALRLAAVLWLSDTIPYSDYFYYHEAGRLAAHDPGFFFRHDTIERYGKLNWWPPGYPMFLAGLYALVGPQFRTAVALQVLLGCAVVALVFAIGQRAAGRHVGLVAALLVAMNPTYIFTTNLVASENLFAPLMALGMWLAGRVGALSAPSPRVTARGPAAVAPFAMRWPAVHCGAVLALATLVRAVGLVLPVVVALWLRPRAGRAAAAWVLAGFALVLAPWTLRNAVVAGSPALVCYGGGLNFYFGHNDGPLGYREIRDTPLTGLGSAAAIDREGWKLGWRTIAAHPLGFFTRAGRKIVALFSPPTVMLHANSAILLPDATADPSLAPLAAAKRARQAVKDRWLHGPLAFLAALHAYMLLAGGIAALVFGWRRLPRELQLSGWMLGAFLLSHILFWAQPRFRYPMEIPLALLAGWAMASRLGRPPAGRVP